MEKLHSFHCTEMMARNKKFEFSLSLLKLLLFFLLVSKGSCDFGLPNFQRKGSDALILLNRCCPQGEKYQGDGHGTFSCVKSPRDETTLFSNKRTERKKSQIPQFFYNDDNDNGSNYTRSFETLMVEKEFLLFSRAEDQNPVKFQLVSTPPLKFKCSSKGNFSVRVKISNGKVPFESSPFDYNQKNGNENESTSNFASLTVTGLLKIGHEYFSQPEFCITNSKSDDEIIVVFVCNATCRRGTPCIQKCCDLNEVWDENGQKCVPLGNLTWTPTFYTDSRTKLDRVHLRSFYPHYKILPPKKWCNRSVYQPIILSQKDGNGRSYTKFRITKDGGVLRRLGRYYWKNTEDDRQFYCIDGGIANDLDSDFGESITSSNNKNSKGEAQVASILFQCGPDEFRIRTWQHVLNGLLMACSCIFLTLTVLVYILLWTEQNVHGYTILSYIISLFFVYFFFVLMYYAQFRLGKGVSARVSSFCQFIGMGNNFFFLATFCWTLILNFDLWCTLRNLKPTIGRSKGIRRFLAYATFSFGVPTIILSVGIGMDYFYGDDYDSSVIVPSYGRMRCLLEPDESQLMYAYGPAGIILILNIIFFTFSILAMCRIQKTTKFATRNSNLHNNQTKSQNPNTQSLTLFSKVLFFMLIPWIFVVSWAGGRRKFGWFTAYYWIFFNVVNLIQAFAIFYIFVCKPDIARSLEKKYPSMKQYLQKSTSPNTSSNTPQPSRT